MKPSVRLVFGSDEIVVHLPAGDGAWAPDHARRWLDEQFLANGCEPLRATGKVLTVDKVLAVADAIGAQGFRRDEDIGLDFARAATSALGQPSVTIDVDARAVTS